MKVVILVPTHDSVHALWAYDLAQMMAFTVASFPEGVQTGLFMEVGTYINDARSSLIQAAMDDGAHYVLWVDSDMRFPPDSLVRLLSHGEPVVGINYAQRAMPTDFVAIKRVPLKQSERGEKLVTGPDSTGLEDVDAMGLGLCLIETAALRRLPDPEKTPWFWFEKRWPGDLIGEDVWFCRLLREHGIQPKVDHDLSKHCGHIGNFTFLTQHAVAERAAAEAEAAI